MHQWIYIGEAMKNLIATVILLAHSGTLLSADDPAVGSPEMGKRKAIICVGCHVLMATAVTIFIQSLQNKMKAT